VLAGQSARARRLLPSRAGARWWDVEFLPLFQDGALLAVLGRVLPVAVGGEAAPSAPLPEKLVALRERVARRADDWFGDDTPRRLVAGLRLAASVAAPVLLVGEPGTGKRTLARAIHFRGAARERCFAALDATRLPPAALAEVLFADRAAAVYIKEPGRLPREMQAELAALLSAAEDERPRTRVLAGCCGDPAAEVREGRLLEELHAVLSPLTLTLPPLRERRDELPRLVERMLARANEDDGRAVRGLAPDAWEVVRAHAWPGNLRELFEVLSAARAHAQDDRVTAADLPAPLRLAVRVGQTPARPPEKPLPLESLLEEAERRLIRLALERSGGHRGRAAEMLGMWRQRLVRRMQALGLSGEDDESRS
jgi:DNA-binding NtrC family response regulator